MKTIISAVLLICILCVSTLAAEQKSNEPKLVRIVTTANQQVFGELRSETATEWKVIDLKTLDETTIKKDEASGPPEILDDKQTITLVGLPTFLAWKIANCTGGGQSGKVAQVTPSALYITLGKRDRIEKGQELAVYREGEQLKDPDSGEVLGRERTKIATVEVAELEEKFCKAIVQVKADSEPKVGDRVVPVQTERAIAIMPWVGVNGNEIDVGKTIAEQLTTGLVKNGIEVVDRTLLDKTLDELNLQQSDISDPESAQKVGKLVGAYAILTGKIVPTTTAVHLPEANLRLIQVQTGKILFATSYIIANKRLAELEAPATPKASHRSSMTSSSSRTAPHQSSEPTPSPANGGRETIVGQWQAGDWTIELHGDGTAVVAQPSKYSGKPGKWRWVGRSDCSFELKWDDKKLSPAWEVWVIRDGHTLFHDRYNWNRVD